MSSQDAGRDITVHVAADRMSAELTVPQGFDPAHLTVAYVEQIATERGVNIDDKERALINEAIHERNGRDGLTAVIAEGVPPQHGVKGRVEWLVDQPPKPAEQETNERSDQADDDKVSHYDRSAFIVVTPGQVIGKLHQETEGQDGLDIARQAVKAKPGTPAKLDVNDTIQIKPDGEIVALCRGVLERVATKASIETQLSVNGDVDFSTGNIDFCGDVIVAKGIKDRFKVRAEGNIEVHGVIEAADIDCDGDLIAKGGFMGGELGNARVGGSLHARYLNDVTGEIEGDLKVDKELINCDLTIFGNLDAPSTSLIGGIIRLVGTGNIHELGSVGGTPTDMALGALPKLEPLAIDLHRIVKSSREQIDGLRAENENLKYISKPSAQQKERMTEIMCDFATADATLQKAENALGLLEARMNKQRIVDVLVTGRIHAGATVIYRGLPMRFKSEIRGPARIRRNEKSDLIVERQGHETPIEHLAGLGTSRAAA
ncbi:MAG: FapA family protein [Phycisphaeraceae bacterium]